MLTTTPPAPPRAYRPHDIGGTSGSGSGEGAEDGMPGVNFDRAAAFYDATRALPDGVAEQVRDAILNRVGARPGRASSRSASARDASRCRSSARATLLRCRSLGGHARRASREVDRRPGAARAGLRRRDGAAVPPRGLRRRPPDPRDPPRRRPSHDARRSPARAPAERAGRSSRRTNMRSRNGRTRWAGARRRARGSSPAGGTRS